MNQFIDPETDKMFMFVDSCPETDFMDQQAGAELCQAQLS